MIYDKLNDRPKGFAYVEFHDIESLKASVSASGMMLLDRKIKVDIADLKERREDHRGTSNYGDRQGGLFSSRYQQQQPRDQGTFQKKEKYSTDDTPGDWRKASSEQKGVSPTTKTFTNSSSFTRPFSSSVDFEVKTSVPKINPFGQAKPREDVVIVRNKVADKI